MKKIIFIVLMLINIIFVSSCGKNNEDNYIPCTEMSGEFCIQVYDPVCGNDGQTYGNSCEACRKVNKYKLGEC